MFAGKISVIIPVFNCESYVERCIDSVLNQNYDNFEVVVINDCSSDGTYNILKKYSNNKKIKILDNKNNKGVSFSRNKGLSASDGEYVIFCDADDYFEEGIFEVLVNRISNDAIRFNNYIIRDGDISLNTADVYSDVNDVVSNKFLVVDLIKNKTESHLWNYMFRNDVIRKNNIKFNDNIKYQEDFLFILEYFCNIKKIDVISEPFYYYNKDNVSSATVNVDNVIRNLKSIEALKKEIFSLVDKYSLGNYDFEIEQRFLNLQMIIFFEYRKKMKIKDYYYFLKNVSDNDDYFCGVNFNVISIKWKIFLNLLYRGHIVLFMLYLDFYSLIKGVKYEKK